MLEKCIMSFTDKCNIFFMSKGNSFYLDLTFNESQTGLRWCMYYEYHMIHLNFTERILCQKCMYDTYMKTEVEAISSS